MKFEYTGCKPVISEHGISFKEGKDDRFLYLPFVYEIIDALNNNYEKNHNCSYDINMQTASIEKLYEKISTYSPNLDKELDEKIKEYMKYLDDETKEVEDRTTLNDISKSIYLENLKLMRDYRIKRAKNKIFYHYCIYIIAEIIKNSKIKEIDLPFNEKFWHILESIQSELKSHKILSDLKINEFEGLKIIFTVNI